MIRFVHGKLVDVSEDLIIVESAGIGYGIRIPLSVLSSLPSIGEEVKIHTYFSVKEDSMELFGFTSAEDRAMFVQLLSVNGVGPKGALGILSVLSPDRLRLAIVSSDLKSIQAAPGIGKKTAERLVLELKDKIDPASIVVGDSQGEHSELSVNLAHTALDEAMQALIALGYSSGEAKRAVSKVEFTEEMTADDVLKHSLRHLSF